MKNHVIPVPVMPIQESDEVLGSLIIKMPLADLDNAVEKSSAKFYLLAILQPFFLSWF